VPSHNLLDSAAVAGLPLQFDHLVERSTVLGQQTRGSLQVGEGAAAAVGPAQVVGSRRRESDWAKVDAHPEMSNHARFA